MSKEAKITFKESDNTSVEIIYPGIFKSKKSKLTVLAFDDNTGISIIGGEYHNKGHFDLNWICFDDYTEWIYLGPANIEVSVNK